MVKARIGTDGTVGMMVRMSEGLRDRIKAAADASGRSQNSEIVATLEEKYPAKTVDLWVLAQFLQSLQQGLSGEEGEEERKAYLQAMNMVLGRLPTPYTVVENAGAVTFYPYRTSPEDLDEENADRDLIAKIIVDNFVSHMSERDRGEFLGMIRAAKPREHD